MLGGFGDVGTTIVPPVLGQWHVEPDHPRTFDIELAKQKLDAAGYKVDANGARLDKEGKPISLRLDYPDTDAIYAKSAQFVKDWYGQLGIKVTAQQFDSATLGNIVLPPDIKGDPESIFDVVQLPTGEVLSVKLRKSSGHPGYDGAVERAILKSSPLPRPDRPDLFDRELKLTFRPKD